MSKKKNRNIIKLEKKNEKEPSSSTIIISFISKHSILLVLFISLTLNFLILNQYLKSPFSKVPVWDSDVYWKRAVEIADGNIIGERIFHQAPFYAYFLAAVIFIFGKSFTPVLIIQSILSSLSTVLIFQITNRISNKKIALISSLIYALYGMQSFYALKLLSETATIFIMLLSVYFILNSEKRIAAIVSGVLTGLLFISKPNLIIIIPFVILYLYWILPKKQFYIKSIQFSLLVVVSVSIVSIRNYHLEKDFVLVSSNGGESFYIGNHEKATGTYTSIEGVSFDIEYQNVDVIAMAEKEYGRKLLRSEVSAFWFKKALLFIKKQPLKECSIILKKFWYLFSGIERSTMYYLYFERDNFTNLLNLTFLSFLLILPFSVLGATLFLKEFKKWYLVYIYPLIIGLGIVVFFYDTRFRLLAIPFLSIFAGAGLLSFFTVFENFNNNRFLQWKPILVLSMCFLFTGAIYLSEKDKKRPDWHMWLTLGDIYYKMDKLDHAFKSYSKASELRKDDWMPVFGVAKVYFDKGNKDIAAQLYNKAFSNINDDFKKLILRDDELDNIRNFIDSNDSAIEVESTNFSG